VARFLCATRTSISVNRRQARRRSLHQELICRVTVTLSKLAVVPSVIFCLATASSHIARPPSPSDRIITPASAQLFVCCKLVTRAHNPPRPSPESAPNGTRPHRQDFHSARARTVNARSSRRQRAAPPRQYPTPRTAAATTRLQATDQERSVLYRMSQPILPVLRSSEARSPCFQVSGRVCLAVLEFLCDVCGIERAKDSGAR
jgi:hypothetical protein